MVETKHDVESVGRAFEISGEFVAAEPYGSGHINDTYAATYAHAGGMVRYIHQRINHEVFKNPVRLMENIHRVTRHQHAKLRASSSADPSRAALTVIPARDGKAYSVDPDKNTWRTYLFIENARTYDVIETESQAFQAAKAFGAFQRALVDLPGDRLHETVPYFHHTVRRFAKFEEALAADSHGRAKEAEPEIAFALERKAMAAVLIELIDSGDLPERITHNDTKLNNVMLDDETQEGICVIDLDTTMPGTVLYDFGDLVRTSTSPAGEDERDLSKVTMQMSMFEALARGYLASAGDFLTACETAHLAFCGKLITFEIGLRFLTDFLEGDTYFKTHRAGHNMDRCRTQFRLVESIESQEGEMQTFVESLS